MADEHDEVVKDIAAIGPRKSIRGEDGRAVEYRAPAEMAQSVALSEELSNTGVRQKVVVLRPKRPEF